MLLHKYAIEKWFNVPPHLLVYAPYLRKV